MHIVIPVLNEAPNFPRLFSGLHELSRQLADTYAMRVILVDDGSTDQTTEVAKVEARDLPLTVLRHTKNRGPGAAFATAFEFLAGVMQDQDWVVTMEGDNTSRHELILQMLTRSKEGFDIILASPYMYGGGFSETTFLRVFLSTAANLFVKEFLGLRGIHTVSSFFRMMRPASIRQLQRYYGVRVLERDGFESMLEFLMKAIFCHMSISEVPMRLDSSKRIGKSKMKKLRTIRGYLSLWFDRRKWLDQFSRALSK